MYDFVNVMYKLRNDKKLFEYTMYERFVLTQYT